MNYQGKNTFLFSHEEGKRFRQVFKDLLFKLFVLSVTLALVLPFVWIPVRSAQSNAGFIRQIRALEGDKTGLLNPAGLAFSSRANAFHALEKKNGSTNTDLVKLTPFADRAGSARIAAAIKDPINVAFDNQVGRLLILNNSGNHLLEVREDANGNLDPRSLTRYDIRGYGLQNPQGMAFDAARGILYILDATGPRLVSVLVGAASTFEGAVVNSIDLSSNSFGSVRGLAFDPSTGNLHIMVPTEQKLFELNLSGEVLAERLLTEFGLKDPQGILFAPSGDQTDDPTQVSLFVVDSGANDTQVTSGSESTGQILELSLAQPTAVAATTFTSSLVKTVDMSQISPPSPDPSGITYLPNNNRLMVVDGEVEETVNGITHFQGANVWELTLGGSVLRTANISKKSPTVVPMTDEPTGVTWNPNDGHFFVTEDGGKRVYNLNPGGDGLMGTSDDSWTYFTTSGVGNGDPEGITFDTCNNRLFVADGVNKEVYQYTLAGSLVSHFDVGTYGVEDPETVEFNPDSCTLFVMSSNRPTPVIVETNLSGGLLQTINISAANAKQPAGLAYAPASNNSGQKRFYIVDRSIDNNNDPKIIDGKMYEMTTPGSGPVSTPTATFTPTKTSTPGPSPTPTLTFTPTPTSPVTDLIFADSFESGSFSAWTSSTTDLGDLSVSASAALVGTRGMQALLDDINSIYVINDTPNAEPRYRARFYFDPNSITMLNGDTHFIFRGYSGTTTVAIRIQFRFSNNTYQVRAGLVDDGSTFTNTSWLTISDASHAIELDWRASTGAGANNGGMTFWIDGVRKADLTGVDNDTRRIDSARLGAVNGVDTGTHGTYYFDAFESRRQTYIGP